MATVCVHKYYACALVRRGPRIIGNSGRARACGSARWPRHIFIRHHGPPLSSRPLFPPYTHPPQAQQQGSLTTPDIQAMSVVVTGITTSAEAAASATPQERDVLLASTATAVDVVPATQYGQLVGAAAGIMMYGAPPGAAGPQAKRLLNIASAGLRAQYDEYRADRTLWPGDPSPGCALAPQRAQKAPPGQVQWQQQMDIFQRSMDYLAEGLGSGERACLTSGSEHEQFCVARAQCQPGRAYATDGGKSGVAVELSRDWYAKEGLPDGAVFDTRVLQFTTPPYYWTSAVDEPGTATEVGGRRGAIRAVACTFLSLCASCYSPPLAELALSPLGEGVLVPQ